MKKLILLIFMSILLAGCSTISYGDFTYTRWGDQSIQGLSVTKDGAKIIVKLDSQKSDAEALIEALKIINALTVAK